MLRKAAGAGRREGGRQHADGDEERGDEHRPDPGAHDRRPVGLASNRLDHPGVGERGRPDREEGGGGEPLADDHARSLTEPSRYSRVRPRLLRDEARKEAPGGTPSDPEAEARHGSVERAAHVPRGGQVPVEQQPVQEQHHEEDHPGERRPEEACELPLEDDRSAAMRRSPPPSGGAGASTETGFDDPARAPIEWVQAVDGLLRDVPGVPSGRGSPAGKPSRATARPALRSRPEAALLFLVEVPMTSG